jgi:hypothetical protein
MTKTCRKVRATSYTDVLYISFLQVKYAMLEGYNGIYRCLTVRLFVLLSKVNVAAAFGLIHSGNFLHNFKKMFLVLQYEDNKTSKSCACIYGAHKTIYGRPHGLKDIQVSTSMKSKNYYSY